MAQALTCRWCRQPFTASRPSRKQVFCSKTCACRHRGAQKSARAKKIHAQLPTVVPRLLRKGYTPRQIAQHYGWTYPTFRRLCNTAGITLPSTSVFPRPATCQRCGQGFTLTRANWAYKKYCSAQCQLRAQSGPRNTALRAQIQTLLEQDCTAVEIAQATGYTANYIRVLIRKENILSTSILSDLLAEATQERPL